ncbi:3-dehydroquinate synthase [Thalassobacillus cyri]|uniref:3-dehydroquinate synthase n=1 Tax=Thalassobacillus cyri TaxID=571932 RepID=A0A1H4CMK6_9BACI|nr:3-dehydroquinate synthase [Thalassobacillus cyri]SEA61685.1 3-dehydroquinate synthase [Thalassobacillus cyri]
MKELSIQASNHLYKVHIGSGLRHSIGSLIKGSYPQILIITDSEVAPLYLEDVKQSFSEGRVDTAVIPAGEQSKCMHQYEQLLTACIENGLDRNSLVVALGGGVVGDLAGFVAATYMRGIDYIQVPTTILAHDSSVGGKVAINHEQGKNMIGCFYSPTQVLYDIETLRTLPFYEIRSGYAEIVKHGCLDNPGLFKDVISRKLTSDIQEEVLIDHLLQGIAIKSAIVEQDEKEKGVRKYLNLGHTLGHAIESEAGYGRLTHGEAVAIGLLFAMYVSREKLGADMPITELYDWLEQHGYPLDALKSLNSSHLIARMKKDKKSSAGIVNMVLLQKLGEPTMMEFQDQELNDLLNHFQEEVMS